MRLTSTSSPTFKEEIQELDKNFTYIVYCRTARRSAIARDIMEDAGFNYAINMTGGIVEWTAQGFTAVK